MKTIKILLADDHTIVRQGLSEIINSFEDFCIIAEADDGYGLIEKYFEFKPDIVLTDIEMPRMKGIEAAKEILEKDNNAKIVFLTMYSTDEYIYISHKIGAKGLIPKSVIKNELVRALRIIAEGGHYFMNRPEFELKELVERYGRRILEVPDLGVAKLNARDKEILLYIAEGLKSEQIADKLNIGKRTVDVERSKIMDKLNLESTIQLVKFAIQYSLSVKDMLK